jgi:hypothetical protein
MPKPSIAQSTRPVKPAIISVMDGLQTLTTDSQITEDNAELVKLRAYQQDQYIAFTAVGGLIPDPEGDKTAIKMTTGQFAERIGVSRQTLYDWRERIPDFWAKVAAKRKEIGSKDRLNHVWNGIYLKAAAGNVEAAKLYFANHDDDFRMPMERRETNTGSGFADLIAQKLIEAAKKQHQPKVIDVDDSANSNA